MILNSVLQEWMTSRQEAMYGREGYSVRIICCQNLLRFELMIFMAPFCEQQHHTQNIISLSQSVKSTMCLPILVATCM